MLDDALRATIERAIGIDGRDRKTAASQIDESLRRLQTDYVDLMQFHEIIRIGDPDRIFGPGGAMEAMLAAQRAGKVRFVGFTGHKDPEIHLKMLQTASQHNFRFDTVQMPLNCFDAHFDSFERKVLPVLVKQQIGVLGMKPLGGGVLLKSNAIKAPEALQYAMSLPVSVVITGCDSIPVLEQALTVARGFRPMTRDQAAALLARTAAPARDGQFELYKTAHQFDGTYRHPEWMGPNVPGETG
jgi:aryl-alcohol dehydrogenase-like predicted oxidoreductase